MARSADVQKYPSRYSRGESRSGKAIANRPLAEVCWQDGRTFASRQSSHVPVTLDGCRIIYDLPMLAAMDNAVAPETRRAEVTFVMDHFSGPIESTTGASGHRHDLLLSQAPRPARTARHRVLPLR